MAKFFGNLNAVMIVGLIAAFALMFGLDGDMVTGNAIGRWLHLFFGVLWIGLLYYLNFVQVPLMPTIPDELKPAVGKHIAPKVLFYFRWAALLTVVTGLYVAWASGWVHQAMTLQAPFTADRRRNVDRHHHGRQCLVHHLAQTEKVLGIVEATADEKAAAGKIALMASRTNVLLSLPMFYAMVNANAG